MNDLKIKPCPFCGGKAELGKKQEDRGIYIFCTICDACTTIFVPIKDDPTELVIDRWNRRASNWISVKDELPKRIPNKEYSKTVIICYESLYADLIDTGYYNFYEKKWYVFAGHSVVVIAWQPLPPLPGVRNEEK